MSAASAVLLFVAYPPFHLLAPSLVALVPLALMAWSARAPHRAARGGFVFGALHYGLLLHWMVPALLRVTATAPMVYATAVLLLALSQALACWMLGLLRRGGGVPLWCALPLVWTAVEWGVAHLPGTLAYPWLGLGTSLTGYPELAGVAELVGARGVTFWLALVNGLVAEGVVRLRARVRRHGGERSPRHGPGGLPGRLPGHLPSGLRPRLRARVRAVRPWLAAALVVAALPAAWGVWRAGRLELRPGPVVAAARTTLRAGAGEVVADLEALAAVDALLAADAPEAPAPALVVLPEGTFRDGLDQAELVAGLGGLARRTGAPVLFGVVRATGRGAGRHNSAALAGLGGLVGEPYDKRRLVPWVERVPLDGLLPGAAGRDFFRAGDEWTVLRAGTLSVGALICYEAAFPGAARALRRAGARVLVNLTNDAWFARGGTFAVAQHEAHLVMRAIETRTGVVRSANLGPAGFVDPAGRARARSDGPEPGVTTARVDAATTHTWFVRLGDVVGPGAAGALLLLLLLAHRRTRANDRPPHLRPEIGH